ncbi:hypothetical protein BGZ70_010057 [Mortierella alpina]|uniref:Uncharacterized protein n=1 Tax=Mortierella alpina TaxID=64518 RepID=A0A9P6J0L7_MORAP|nr:hypothetical protein BGZ70_010057 [Mortierella alpina]
MEEIQSFRLSETTNTVKITLSHVAEQDVAFWKEIEQAFPGFKRVRHGNPIISFTRVADPQSPSSVLDVVLTTSTEPVGASDTLDDDIPVGDKVLDALQVAQPSKARLFQQIAARATKKAQMSEVEQRFISLLPSNTQETVRASSDIYQAFSKAINDDGGDEELTKAELW